MKLKVRNILEFLLIKKENNMEKIIGDFDTFYRYKWVTKLPRGNDDK